MRLLTIDRPSMRIRKCWCNKQRTKSFGKRGRESDGLKRDVPVRKNPYKGINLNKKNITFATNLAQAIFGQNI